MARRVRGAGVDRGERLRDPQGLHAALEEPLEEVRRVGPLRGDEPARLQDREHDRRGVAEAPEGVDEHLGAREVERGALRRALRARREGGEHLDPLLRGARALELLERRVQAPERLLVVRRVLQRLPPDLGRAAEPGGVVPEPGELHGEGPPLLAGGAGAPRLELLRELLLLARAAHAGLERGRGAPILRVHRDEVPPRLHRLVRLLEVPVEDLGDAPQQGLAVLEVVRDGVRRGPVRAGELEERVGAGGGALHRLARRGARGIDRERPRERPEGLARLAQPFLLDLGEPLEQPDALLRVPRERGGQLEHPRERDPLAGVREQRRERGGRGALPRVGAERGLEVPARARGVAEPLLREHRGPDAERRVRPLLRRRREVALEDAERLREPAGVHEVLERLERGALAGRIELERLLEGRERALGVPEADEVDPRHLEVEEDERGPIPRAGGEPRERIRVAAVVAALSVDPAQQRERERVPRRERPGALDPLEPAGEPLGIVRDVELREPELEARRLPPVVRARGGVLERARLLAPGARERLEPLARLGGPRRGAIERRRLDERVHREIVLERLLHQGRPEPGVLRRERLAIAAAVAHRVEHALRLPVAAQRGEAGEPARPGLVEPRIEPAGAGVQERGAVAAAEPLLVDLPEPEGRARRLPRILRRRGLPLDGRRERAPVLALLQDIHHRA